MITSRVSATRPGSRGLNHSPVLRALRCLYVFQNFHRREPAGCAHDAAAGMGCGAAHIKIADRRAELRVTRHRAQEEKLLQRELALEDVSFAQAELAFQIQ